MGENRAALQLEVIQELKELFLDVPLQPLLPCDELGKVIRDEDADRQELAGLKQQYFQIVELTEKCGGMEPWFLARLVCELQYKAQAEIAVRNALAQTSDPTSLRKHGVPEHIIENAIAVRDYFHEMTPKKFLEGNVKGGLQRTDEEQKNYDEHREWWGSWMVNPSLYPGVTKYVQAMEDKTGTTDKTIRQHIKDFKKETGWNPPKAKPGRKKINKGNK